MYRCRFIDISAGTCLIGTRTQTPNSTASLKYHFLFDITVDLVAVQEKSCSIGLIFCTYIIYKKTTSIFQTIVCKPCLSKLSLLEKLKSCINTMENADTTCTQWLIMYRILGHCGIKCLTLYFDVSWYWVIGLSAIPHVPTPTFPFTLSGDANMLLFTCPFLFFE